MTSVRLSPVQMGDCADLIAANHASTSYHAPWTSPFKDEEGFQSWFSQTVTGANIGLVARESGSNGVVGVLTLSQIVLGNFRSCFLGYYGMAAFAGQGLMTQALNATLAYAFDQVGLNRVEANIQPGNHRSIALVQRCGFEKEGFSKRYLKINGEWCDHERWARLAD